LHNGKPEAAQAGGVGVGSSVGDGVPVWFVKPANETLDARTDTARSPNAKTATANKANAAIFPDRRIRKKTPLTGKSKKWKK
jgi:hypothetical protein